MPIEVRDSGTDKTVQSINSYDSGTDKKVQEVIVHDSGVDKTAFTGEPLLSGFNDYTDDPGGNLPNGWTLEEGPTGGTYYTKETTTVSEGSASWFVDTYNYGGRIIISQTFDLTDYDQLLLDMFVENIGSSGGIYASINGNHQGFFGGRKSGNTTTGQWYYDQSIDVSGLSGSHSVEIRFPDSSPYPYVLYRGFIDNLRGS